MSTKRHKHRAAGFTLVELLTVIAIITLLISVLIPSVAAIRNQGKDTATAAQIKALSDACEVFRNDVGNYPDSRGFNPFESGEVELMGANWLALQLVGVDSRGYVRPTLENDSNGDREINELDWLDWYDLDPARDYTRLGPYVEPDPEKLQTIIGLSRQDFELGAIPSGLFGTNEGGAGGSSVWDNGRIPFFVDAHGFPILYYRANRNAEQPYTTGTENGLIVGTYDQADNAFYTGSDGDDGRFPINTPGADLAATATNPNTFRHPIGLLGYTPGYSQFPQEDTFARFTYDEEIFERTLQGVRGRIVPRNPDTFLLISAGRDGLWGNENDITNFPQ